RTARAGIRPRRPRASAGPARRVGGRPPRDPPASGRASPGPAPRGRARTGLPGNRRNPGPGRAPPPPLAASGVSRTCDPRHPRAPPPPQGSALSLEEVTPFARAAPGVAGRIAGEPADRPAHWPGQSDARPSTLTHGLERATADIVHFQRVQTL